MASLWRCQASLEQVSGSAQLCSPSPWSGQDIAKAYLKLAPLGCLPFPSKGFNPGCTNLVLSSPYLDLKGPLSTFFWAGRGGKEL